MQEKKKYFFKLMKAQEYVEKLWNSLSLFFNLVQDSPYFAC